MLLVGHKRSKMKVMMPFPLGRCGRMDAVIGYCFKRPKWVRGGGFVQPWGAVQPAQKPGGGTCREPGGGAEEGRSLESEWVFQFVLV